jgi:hypothetical protein
MAWEKEIDNSQRQVFLRIGQRQAWPSGAAEGGELSRKAIGK